MLSYKKVLSIAGSDSSGGAGVQADIKTISALGAYAMTVITAITAQNTQSVDEIYAPPADIIKHQCSSIFSDMGADAVKIGMLYSEEIINIVSSCIDQYSIQNIILDPVMIAKDGSRLLCGDTIVELKKLFPKVSLITPNIPEAECLLNDKIKSLADMYNAAKILACDYRVNVLLKGGHLSGNQCNDVICLHETTQIHHIASTRIDTRNTHGTGCTLSAAIATYLAKGHMLIEAVTDAHAYLHNAIVSGSQYLLGKGCGPVNHMCGVACYA